MSYNLFINYKLPKPLPKDELLECIKKAREGDMEARDKVVTHNIKLVLNQVNGRFCNAPYDKEELVGVGVIGLIKGIDTFDPSKNFQFTTYVTRCIDNEILMFFRSNKKYLNNQSIYEPINISPKGDELHIEDTLEDPDSDFTERIEIKFILIELSRLVNLLPDREKFVIKRYFGFDDEEPCTQTQIAEMLDLSRSYISRIYNKAISILREGLSELGFIGDGLIISQEGVSSFASKNNFSLGESSSDACHSIVSEDVKTNDNSCLVDLSQIRNMPFFLESLKLLDARDAVILCLLVGYINDKCFSQEEIADYLGIDLDDVRDSIKKSLLLYKNIINNLFDKVVDDNYVYVKR